MATTGEIPDDRDALLKKVRRRLWPVSDAGDVSAGWASGPVFFAGEALFSSSLER
jgi:hypothetical protein